MYQALYRRYRPKTFHELLGQHHITTTLKNQIKNENIGHAYLFSGTRGTGKTSAAKIFSRAVNCLDSQDGEPCNKCKNCVEILKETTVDVVEMDAASNNKVDDIRELREKVIYPPTNIKKKVYIIDEVHMLSNSAFNALLKTLEEPPKHLIFILATTEPEKIPQTILSRCQRFDFKRIQSTDIVENMEKITGELAIEVDREVLSLIARNSDGAMRDALSLLDQCISFSENKIEYSDALDLLGIANTDILFTMIDNIKDKKLEDALDSLETINQSGKDLNRLVKDLISHFRNLMIIKSSKNPETIIDIDNIEKFKTQAEKMSIEFILKSLNILIDAENKGRWSGEIRLILEIAIIKMVDIEEELSLLERIKRLEEGFVPRKEVKIENTRENLQTESVVEKPREKSVATPKKENIKEEHEGESFIDLDLETISNHWDIVLKEIKVKKVSLYALIREGKLNSFSNNQLEINYDEEFGFHHGAVNKEDNKQLVEEIISKYFNIDIVVDFSLGSIISNKSKEKEKTDEDAIKEVIDFFGEDIVEIE
ncbi:DNA polymerase III subunit gamma/tau [Tissierella creatinophila]|uniref:DNA-directed DNA polymerase n=1 Tax=Tissierella creatinophila DSM 6911 TaxID=1123403 RepID=A0A1U7M844_TISCR|nr:DNA polymerase III subunit gamma/tau [Tissierella creatinophila]OLS03456.1 DNA polymerase III subunit tau [Tissierella creatinophila DSM 6911]